MSSNRSSLTPNKCVLCDSAGHEQVAAFSSPLKGENTFGVENYYRELWRCRTCGLYSNQHQYDLSTVYSGLYGQVAYDYGQQKSRFDSIMNLPEDRSDNRGRVKRINSYLAEKHPHLSKELLDVGCGMAVFPAVMQEKGWDVTAIDPNPLSVEHAEKLALVNAIIGSFPSTEIGRKFSLITFNKVLEHIKDVVECLSAARSHLHPGGAVYVELPDGEMAIEVGSDRQEFYFEHYFAFGCASIALLAKHSGFIAQRIERLVEPSGKRTIYAFLTSAKS